MKRLGCTPSVSPTTCGSEDPASATAGGERETFGSRAVRRQRRIGGIAHTAWSPRSPTKAGMHLIAAKSQVREEGDLRFRPGRQAHRGVSATSSAHQSTRPLRGDFVGQAPEGISSGWCSTIAQSPWQNLRPACLAGKGEGRQSSRQREAQRDASFDLRPRRNLWRGTCSLGKVPPGQYALVEYQGDMAPETACNSIAARSSVARVRRHVGKARGGASRFEERHGVQGKPEPGKPTRAIAADAAIELGLGQGFPDRNALATVLPITGGSSKARCPGVARLIGGLRKRFVEESR